MHVTKQFKRHTKASLLKANTENEFRSIMAVTLIRLLEHGQQDWPCFQNNGKYFLHWCEHFLYLVQNGRKFFLFKRDTIELKNTIYASTGKTVLHINNNMPEKTPPAAASRVLLEKLTYNHVVRELLAFYETQGCIISFLPINLILSQTNIFHNPPSHFFEMSFNIILTPMSMFASGLYP